MAMDFIGLSVGMGYTDETARNLLLSSLSNYGEKCLILGDSMGDTSVTINNRYPQWTIEFENLTQNLLEIENKCKAGCSISTANINNNLSTHILPLISEQYSHIILFMGWNDYNGNVIIGSPTSTDTSTFYGGLNYFANWVKNNQPNAKIYIASPLLTNVESSYKENTHISFYVTALYYTCVRYGFNYIDTFGSAPMLSRYTIDKYLVDGIHPTSEYATKYLAPFILQNMIFPNKNIANLCFDIPLQATNENTTIKLRYEVNGNCKIIAYGEYTPVSQLTKIGSLPSDCYLTNEFPFTNICEITNGTSFLHNALIYVSSSGIYVVDDNYSQGNGIRSAICNIELNKLVFA